MSQRIGTGEDSFLYAVTDGANTSAPATVRVDVFAGMRPIDLWRQTHFPTWDNDGAGADQSAPNHNGIVNLLEYALGGNPNNSSSGQSILPRAAWSNRNSLQLSFTRYLDRTDLTLTVSAADTVEGPWMPLARSVGGGAFTVLAGGAVVSETGSGATRSVVVEDIYVLPNADHSKRFMRLEVTQ